MGKLKYLTIVSGLVSFYFLVGAYIPYLHATKTPLFDIFKKYLGNLPGWFSLPTIIIILSLIVAIPVFILIIVNFFIYWYLEDFGRKKE